MKEETTTEIPLASFQKWMQQMLLDPYQQTGNATDLLPGTFENSSLEAVVNHSGKLPARDHLAIYQRSYIARLRNCMAQQFSALEYALGEELFCAFADQYLAENPSGSYNLAGLGAKFPDYLEANRPDQGEAVKEDWPDFMIELARFEFAISEVFEEKADEDYKLAKRGSDEGQLSLVPICYLFKLRFPVRWFYTEFKNDNQPELPFERESYCVVLRHDYKLALYDLHKVQFEFLNYMKEGLDIAGAKEKFIAEHPNEREQFEALWPNWKEKWIETKFFRI